MIASPNNALAILGRIVLVLGAICNSWFAIQVIEVRYGGVAKAQADFDLFLLLITIGGPIAVVAMFVLIALALTNVGQQKSISAMGKNPVVLLCAFNLLMPIGLLAYLFATRA